MGVKNESAASMTSANPIRPCNEAEMADILIENHSRRSSLFITGGGTRLDGGATEAARTLSTTGISGIVAYEPGALTLICRAGTPLEEIEATLLSEGQALAFEPMDHRPILGSRGVPTIGGVVAGNISGPRRLLAGACRDHLLGVRFVDGQGRILKSGGRVMKNVTGLDLSKLICGSYGTLGVLTEVALKTLPIAETQQSLSFANISWNEAMDVFATALATPFEVSGAAYRSGTAFLRLEGFAAQVAYRTERLATLFRKSAVGILSDGASREIWRGFRDVQHFAGLTMPLWRILLKPSEAPSVAERLLALGGEVSADWGGGLLWYCGPGDGTSVRRAVGYGKAMLARCGPLPTFHRFPAETAPIAELSAALRRSFDPAGILNPKLMEE